MMKLIFKIYLIIGALIALSSCNKVSTDNQALPAGNYPMKAEVYLNSSLNSNKLCIDFLKCVDLPENIEGSQGNSLFDEFIVNLTNGNCTPPTINFYLNDTSYGSFFKIKITINGKTDYADVSVRPDYVSINLKSTNAVTLRGSNLINRLKPNLVWGYIEYKDSTYLPNGKAFLDSLKNAAIVKTKNLNPGDYYLFQVAADSSISHLWEQSAISKSGFTQPFLFQYNGSTFESVRSVAEKFVYELKDLQGIKIFIKDSNGTMRLIEYYL